MTNILDIVHCLNPIFHRMDPSPSSGGKKKNYSGLPFRNSSALYYLYRPSLFHGYTHLKKEYCTLFLPSSILDSLSTSCTVTLYSYFFQDLINAEYLVISLWIMLKPSLLQIELVSSGSQKIFYILHHQEPFSSSLSS